jgi:hypothetical protein
LHAGAHIEARRAWPAGVLAAAVGVSLCACGGPKKPPGAPKVAPAAAPRASVESHAKIANGPAATSAAVEGVGRA